MSLLNPLTPLSASPSDFGIPPRWRIVHSEASLGWGGQEHRTLTELVGLHRRGHEVVLVASPRSMIFKRAVEFGIPVYPVLFGRAQMLFDIWKLGIWLKSRRIQILNTHSSRDGWLLGLAGRLAGVPLILRTRHIDVDYPSPRISRVAYRTLADHVLTTSDKITAHLQRIFDLPNHRITTLPTGIDLKKFFPDGTRACLGDGPLVGMVSVLRSWKGHVDFLRAAALLKGSGFRGRFVIVGGGQSPKWIEETIDELGLGDVVTLFGHREDIPEVLRALDLLVIPSTRHEGIPQIGLQALATKTAVVGSDVGGIPEIIRDGETGRLFPAGDIDAFANAIRSVFSESERTDRMREQGRELVEKCHSVENMLDKIENLYRGYLTEREGRFPL